MKHFFPLRYTLPVLFIVISLLGQAAFYFYSHRLHDQQFNEFAEREIEHLDQFAKIIKEFIAQSGINYAISTLSHYGDKYNQIQLYLIDQNNIIIASHDPDSLGTKHTPLSTTHRVLDETLHAYYPITLPAVHNNQQHPQQATLYLRSDLAIGHSEFHQILDGQPVVSNLMLVIELLILWLLIKIVINRRITTLKNAAQRVGEGMLSSRAEIGQGDELATLAHSFNDMAEQLEALHKAVDQHTMLAIYDSQWMLQHVNDEFCRMSGYSRDELIGQSHQTFTPADEEKTHYEEIQTALHQGKIWHGILHLQNRSGNHYWMQTTTVPILDEQGGVQKLIAIHTDITQHEKMRRAMASLAAISDNSYDAIVEAVANALQFRCVGLGRLVGNSGDCIELLGLWKNGEASNLYQYNLLDTPCADICNQTIPCVISKEVAKRYPNAPILDGLYAESYIGVPIVERNQTIGVLFAINDTPCENYEVEQTVLTMAARRAAMEIKRGDHETQLHESKMQLAATQSMAHLGGWWLDVGSQQLHWSDEVFRIYGVQPEQFDGCYESYLSFIHPDDVLKVRQAFNQALESGSHYAIEHRIISHRGTIKWVLEQCEITYDNNRKVQQVVGYTHDITARKQAEIEKEFITQGAVIAAETQSFQEALEHNLELICQYTGWPVGHAYIVENDKERIVSIGSWSINTSQTYEAFRQITEQTSFKFEEGLPGRVWKEGKIEWVPNIQKTDNFIRTTAATESDIKGAVAFPVIVGSQVEAIMEFFSHGELSPDVNLERLLTLYADQLGRIFERHSQEQELRKSEQRFNLALRASNDGLWDWSPNSNEIFYSKRWKEMLGYEEQELDNHFSTWDNLIHPDDKAKMLFLIQKCLDGDADGFDDEFRLRHKDGHWVNIRSRATVVHNESGEPERIVGTHTDISDRKRSELALIRSQQQLREEHNFVNAVLNETASVIVVLDRYGNIIRFNRHAEKITGYQFRELENIPIWETLIPEKNKESVRNVFENLITGESITQYENEWVMKDGSLRLFDWRNATIKASNGEVDYVIAQGIDITEQRKTELILARDREQQSAIRALLETVIHDNSGIKETLDDCLKVIFETSALIEGSGGGIFLLNEENILELVSHKNLPGDVVQLCSKLPEGICQCGKASQTCEIQFSPADLPDRINNEFHVDLHHHRYSLPLLSTNGSLGVLIIYLPKRFHRDANIEQFFASVADILAGYINRKKHEQAVIESEMIYHSVTETSNDGFWMVDRAGNIMEVNHAYCELTGYSSNEICNMTISELESNESHEEIQSRIEKIIHQGNDLFETEHKTKDGRKIPIEISVSYWPVSGGRFFAFIRDISERKENERSLTQYQEHLEDLVNTRTNELHTANLRLESIIENLPAIFYIKDNNGRYQMVNRRFEEAAGINKQQLLEGQNQEPLKHNIEGKMTTQCDQFLLEKSEPLTFEERLLHPDGSTHDYLTTKLPLLNDKGTPYALMGIMADISQQKQLQRDLSSTMAHLERRAKLEHLVSTITSRLIGMDPDTLGDEIKIMLEELGEFTKSDRCSLIEVNNDQKTLSICHQWCAQGVKSSKSFIQDIPLETQIYAIERLQYDLPINIAHKQSSGPESQPLKEWLAMVGANTALILPVSYSGELWGAITLDSLGEHPGWSEDDIELLKTQGNLLGQVLHNIATQKALRIAKEEAEHLAKAKSEFLANMSHEIRTPLNAVLGLAQVGVRDNVGRNTRKNFTNIFNSGKHLLELVNDILDFSKLEAGKLTTEKVLFRLGDSIDQALAFISAEAFQKGLNIIVNEAEDIPESIIGDPMRLTQILGNLLGNALKFTEQGTITLTLKRDQHHLFIDITDTGIGMTQEQVTRLFKPFEQADSSTTRRFGGTGLGLAISYRLIEAMEGEIKVKSQPSVGSRFTLKLPLISDNSPANTCNICKHMVATGLPKRVMIDLKEKLQRLNLPLPEIDPLEALQKTNEGYLLISQETLLDPQTYQAAVKAAENGVTVIMLNIPGLETTPNDEQRSPFPSIDWPVRLRNLQQAIKEKHEFPSSKPVLRLLGLHILAVEDTELNREVLADILEHEGAKVTFAENGQVAVDIIHKESDFDIVLMDIQMPIMDGYEATKQIKALHPNLTIIGLTAHAFAEEKARCIKAGMVSHISKPIDVDILITEILRHTDKQETIMPIKKSSVTTEGDHPDIIDWQALNERFSNRDEFIRKILRTARSSAEKVREGLIQAMAKENFDELAFSSHTLKGIAGNIMADSLQELAAKVEMDARNKQPQAFTHSKELLQILQQMTKQIERQEQASKPN